MKTITDEEAFALGVRAVKAGMDPSAGIRVRVSPALPSMLFKPGLVVGVHQGDLVTTSKGHTARFHPDEFVPDLRDPGTKGHAVAQLRIIIRDPGFKITMGWDNDRDRETWIPDIEGIQAGTEEEAIVAAFEATKQLDEEAA